MPKLQFRFLLGLLLILGAARAQTPRRNAAARAGRATASTASPMPAYKNPRLSIHRRVADLMRRMTLEEKIGQLTMALRPGRPLRRQVNLLDTTGTFTAASGEQALRELFRLHNQLGPRRTAILRNALQRYQIEKTRLGIPVLEFGEALHGFMQYDATSFPNPLGLASTWDPRLVRQIYRAAGDEARSEGVDQVFAPDLDLGREPRWGRTEETFGEDPYLVSRMGLAEVQGLQGRHDRINRHHVLATAKHFAAHGQPEGGRNTAPASLGERTLRQEFLLPFKVAVERGRVGSIMASYNEIDGVPSGENYWLLTRELRQRWGFRGYVTSDGGGLNTLITEQHVAATPAQAAREALRAGLDYELGAGIFATLLPQAQSGRVPMRAINRAVRRVLRAKFRLGLFDHPYTDPRYAARVMNSLAHRRLALRAAEEGITLLKNRGGILPFHLRRLHTLAVIGPNAAPVVLGGYSRDPGPGHQISILEGIRKLAAAAHVRVLYAPGCRITNTPAGWAGFYANHVTRPAPGSQEAAIRQAAALARRADAVVLVVGDNETTDREAWSDIHRGDLTHLGLLAPQGELVRKVMAAGKPTAVVLVNGRPLAIRWIAAHVPAILEAWYPGEQGGTAVAEAVFGKINPGGKLPISVPRSAGALPDYYNHKPSLFRKYEFTKNGPLFPFGFGLSYTTFAYHHLQVTPAAIPRGGRATLSVDVTNTGTRAGAAVVEYYLHQRVSPVVQPVLELRGFRRVRLAPGETRRVQFPIHAASFSILDLRMQRTVEPGWYDLEVGPSSAQTQSVALDVTR